MLLSWHCTVFLGRKQATIIISSSPCCLPAPYYCCWLREAVHATRGINWNCRSKFRGKPPLARGQQLPFIQLHQLHPGTLSLLYLSCLNSAYAPFFIPQSHMITALQAWRIKGSKGHKLILANFLPERTFLFFRSIFFFSKMVNMWWWDRYQMDFTPMGTKKIYFFPRKGKSWIHQWTSTGAFLRKIIKFSSHWWDFGTKRGAHVPVPQPLDLFVSARPELRKHPINIQTSRTL